MNVEAPVDMGSANARSLAFGRLAQAFAYPENGKESLLAAVDYTTAFDPAASPEACSLREYSYAKDIHATSLNEELLRFYHFFGLTRSVQAVMPDHISVELEFMQVLAMLEAAALVRGEEVTSLMKAQRDFLSRHLRILANGIQSSFRAEAPGCKILVDITVEVVGAELRRLNDEIGLAGDAAA